MTWNSCSIAHDKPAQQRLAAAGVAGAEHANARQLDIGCERPHDARARRSVAAEVALGVLDHLQLAVVVAEHCDGVVDATHEWMVELDSAVEDADPDTGAGGAAPGPLPGHLVRQRDGHADPVDRLGRQAPGGKVLVLGVLVQLDDGAHRTPIIAGSGQASWCSARRPPRPERRESPRLASEVVDR